VKYRTLGYRLPSAISVPLFGDRARHGLAAVRNDPTWREWQRIMLTFYDANQKRGIGKIVNDAGDRVRRRIDLTGKRVLEIGPGSLNHIPNWRGQPASYALVDIEPECLDRGAERLREHGVPVTLEHLYPLSSYLGEFLRVLKSGGVLIGAIPAEGGLAWGLGRFLTTRRWMHRNTNIDPDMVICWAHPNFANAILWELDTHMRKRYLRFWPAIVPSIDANLVIKFIYEKR